MSTSTMSRPLRVAVIIGSTRENRMGDGIGRWFSELAEQRADFELDVLDLLDFEFPSRYPNEPTPQVCEFVGRIGKADAFVVVTPEYNHSFPAPVKQAIDLAYDEWQAKPVGYVSYGLGSVGWHAVEHLRAVFTELQAVSVRDGVGFDLLGAELDGRGRPIDTESHAHSAKTMLDQLAWWGQALRDARAARPYVS